MTRCSDVPTSQGACLGGRFLNPGCPDCAEWQRTRLVVGLDYQRMVAYRGAVRAGVYSDWPDGKPLEAQDGIVGFLARGGLFR